MSEWCQPVPQGIDMVNRVPKSNALSDKMRTHSSFVWIQAIREVEHRFCCRTHAQRKAIQFNPLLSKFAKGSKMIPTGEGNGALIVKVPSEWADHESLTNLLRASFNSISSRSTSVIHNLNEFLSDSHNIFDTNENADILPELRQTSIMCMVEHSQTKGDERLDAEDYDAAIAAWREGLIIQRQHLPASHLDIATTLNKIGIACQRRGSHYAAMVALKEALRIRQTQLGQMHQDTVETENALWALLYAVDGDEGYHEQQQQQGRQDQNISKRKTSIAKCA